MPPKSTRITAEIGQKEAAKPKPNFPSSKILSPMLPSPSDELVVVL